MDGKEQGFSAVVANVGDEVRSRVVQSLVGADQRLSYADAEDCFQKAWLSAFLTLKTTDRGSIVGFLFLVAHRRAIDITRRSRQAVPVADPASLDTRYLNASEKTPQEIVELSERVTSLLNGLTALRGSQRKVALMRYLYDVRPAEICTSLKLSRKQYEGVLNRARLSLQDSERRFTTVG